MNAVAFEHIDKSFSAVAALRDVTFAITRGESHAIVGENGAGKSTLLNSLAGSLRPDRGQVNLSGLPVALASPRDALARGIGLVHQEMLAFPNLSAAANILAGVRSPAASAGSASPRCALAAPCRPRRIC